MSIIKDYGDWNVDLRMYGITEPVKLSELVREIRHEITSEVLMIDKIRAVYEDENLNEIDRDNAVYEIIEGLS